MVVSRSRPLLGTLIACLGTFSLALGAESAVRPDDLPGIRGAVHEPPAWVDGTEPFDVKAFFTSPPVEENAAFPYFDALFEFSAEVDGCFGEAPDVDVRRKTAQERHSRYFEFTNSLKADQWSVPVEKIDKFRPPDLR